MLYKDIIKALATKKLLAVLVDPDAYDTEPLKKLVETVHQANAKPGSRGVDYFLAGGSLVSSQKKFEETIQTIKQYTSIPVIIFPGSIIQVSDKADGLLVLSLLSGRNPDYLIGNHVLSAMAIKQACLETIPTGYILVENGRTTSVEYISGTRPIPADKHDIAIATAVAGELLGNKLIYLEAGSGAANSVECALIQKVRENISIPLIVGGGIRNKEQMEKIFAAGADMVVVGNALEQNQELVFDLV